MASPPVSGTIVVGDDPNSASYVRRKHAASADVGLVSHHVELPNDVVAGRRGGGHHAVQRRSGRRRLHRAAAAAGTPRRRSGALRSRSRQGRRRLASGQSRPAADGRAGPSRPCTALGIQTLLVHYGVPIERRHVVIVGRGLTVGRPLSVLLSLKEPYTPTRPSRSVTRVPPTWPTSRSRPTSSSRRPACQHRPARHDPGGFGGGECRADVGGPPADPRRRRGVRRGGRVDHAVASEVSDQPPSRCCYGIPSKQPNAALARQGGLMAAHPVPEPRWTMCATPVEMNARSVPVVRPQPTRGDRSPGADPVRGLDARDPAPGRLGRRGSRSSPRLDDARVRPAQ